MPTERETFEAFEALMAARSARENGKNLQAGVESQKPSVITIGRVFNFAELEQVRTWETNLQNATTTHTGAKREYEAAIERIKQLVPSAVLNRVYESNVPVIVSNGSNRFLALYMQDDELAVLEGQNANALLQGIQNYQSQKNAIGFDYNDFNPNSFFR